MFQVCDEFFNKTNNLTFIEVTSDNMTSYLMNSTNYIPVDDTNEIINKVR
jgi:hypothetical protein